MPSSRYYRVQARILLGWAIVTSDQLLAERLRARARDLERAGLAAAETEDAAGNTLARSLDEFNERQMRDP